MKILHTADLHLGAYVGPQCDDPYKRMENTIKCLDKVVETARQEKPDIILIAGDIFHTAKVWSDRALTEVRIAAKYINLLSQFCPIAVLYGTPNHDGVQQFTTLQEMTPGIIYFTEPRIQTLLTSKSGPIQIAGLPGFDKGHFRAQFPGLSAEEENRVFSEQMRLIVDGLSAQVDSSIPSVLMAHHTVVGCDLDNGQSTLYMQNEMVLEAATLDNSSFDLVCLGHIHKAQRVESCSKPVYYAGSVDAFTFNDEGHEKGYWMHNMDEFHMDRWNSEFIETPARKFNTFNCDQEIMSHILKGEELFGGDSLHDKVVRILYTCDSETEKALDKKKLERDLYAAGAYYVSEIRPEKIHEVVNKEQLNEKLTVWDCLLNYLREKKINTADIDKLFTEATPIISKIEASAPAGGQTGLFMPLEIEVRNYRSYAEEKLSFQDIFFAMVNGRNGSGKSSLFMDALVDCLYEQPREGELTGWIRAGEKSGAITFTFQLGGDVYRVTRTRQKSGKATLSISFDGIQGPGGPVWEDISCQKLVDTQDKIIQLLGMDCETFKSCVLIMQDQYGKFMEAKSEDRMGVLANLLGLGIYEQLEDETKKLLQEVNRELRTAKEEAFVLEQEVEQMDYLQKELDTKRKDLNFAEGTLTLLKQQKDEAATKVATFGQLKLERDRLLQEAISKELSIKDKNFKLDDLIKNASQTRIFLESETDLNLKHSELLVTKQKLAAMDSTVKLVNDKELQIAKLSVELLSLGMEKSKLERDMQTIQQRLQGIEELQESLNNLEDIEDALTSWGEKEKKYRDYYYDLELQNAELNKIRQLIDSCKKQTSILQNSNCIDIENAQCGFLKAAKEAKIKLEELSVKEIEQQEVISRLAGERLALGYNSEQHQACKESSQDYRRIKQQLASLEGDKKLLEVHTLQLDGVLKRISTIEAEKAQIETDLAIMQKEIAGYTNLQVMVKKLEQSEQQWQQIPVARKYLETICPQIDELEKETKELLAAAYTYREKASELFIQVQDLQRNIDELAALNRSIQDYEATVGSYNRNIGSLQEKYDVLLNKRFTLEATNKGITELAERAAKLQLLLEAFSQDGIPHQIIRDIVPELEASANEILGQMTGGRMRLEFRTERVLKSNKAKEVATLDIVIIDVDNGELPYLSRSGGQKVRAALAVSFALAMIKANRVGLQLGMMFVDEPPFLDAEGIEAYCMALETIHSKYPDMRIVAISHDENMKARFPQQITIVTGENGSKVVRS